MTSGQKQDSPGRDHACIDPHYLHQVIQRLSECRSMLCVSIGAYEDLQSLHLDGQLSDAEIISEWVSFRHPHWSKGRFLDLVAFATQALEVSQGSATVTRANNQYLY